MLQVWLNGYPQIREIYVSIFSKQFVEKAKVSKNSKFLVTVAQFLYLSYTSDHIDNIYF